MSLTEAGGGLVAGSRRLLQLAGDLHDNVRVPGESLCGQVALGPDTGQPEAPASQRRSRRRRPAARLAATFPTARHGVLQRMGGPVMLTIAKGMKMQIRRVVAGTGADGQAVILSDGFAPHGQRRAISAPGRPGPISPGQAEPSGCAVLRHDRGLVAPQRCRRAV